MGGVGAASNLVWYGAACASRSGRVWWCVWCVRGRACCELLCSAVVVVVVVWWWWQLWLGT